ncbi:MAG: hemolysin XhlA family protein [Peptostreptococcaceae bacterium]
MNDETLKFHFKRQDEINTEVKESILYTDKRVDKLEQGQAEFKVEIKNLCKSIEGLTSILKWVFGFLISGGVGFFFYAIQNHLFK